MPPKPKNRLPIANNNNNNSNNSIQPSSSSSSSSSSAASSSSSTSSSSPAVPNPAGNSIMSTTAPASSSASSSSSSSASSAPAQARSSSSAPTPAPSTGTQGPSTVQVKLVLLGQAAVGKSSLVRCFANKDFQANCEPTIGAAFMTQKCKIDDKTIKFEIWDTAGQERFHSLAPMYYRNAAAAVVVYDLTSKTSFDMAKVWVAELKSQSNATLVIALVGNKSDLLKQNESLRQVTQEEAEAYASELGLHCFESSAKLGTSVDEIFYCIARKIPYEELAARAMSRTPGIEIYDSQSRATTAEDSNNCAC